MITIKDIAKKAGVSIATVSYVLNNSAQISEETRKKVLEIAKEMGYQPNNIAKSLKIKKTHTIGIITEDITVFSTPEIIDGINKYAHEKGYNIVLNNLRLFKRFGNNYSKVRIYKKEIKEVTDVLLSRQVEGIIYIGFHTRDVGNIIDIDIPVIYTYCYSQGKHCVNYNDYLAAYQLTHYLIKMGHREIGVITGLTDSLPSQERLRGYKKALEDNLISFNPNYVKIGNWEYEEGYNKAKELLNSNIKPTAIFAMNDLMAGGAIEAAYELGINVPEHLSIVGFDDRECSFYFTPKLTTMRLPLHEMGEVSAKMLIDIINNKQPQEKFVLLDCKLIERNSVRKIT